MDNFQQQLFNSLEEIIKISDVICSSKEVTRIDIDMLKEKLRATYDVVISYSEPKVQKVVEQKREIKEIPISFVFDQQDLEEKEVVKEIVVQHIKKEEISPLPLQQSKEEEKVSITEQVQEKDIAPEKENIQEKDEVVQQTPIVLNYLNNNVNHQPTLDLFSEKSSSTIADKYEQPKSVFEAMVSNSKPEDVSHKFVKPISDLRTAIGVNEKFMFINDLFSGNLREYTEFIQLLNDSSDVEQAKSIAKQKLSQKKWVESSLSYSTLITILERRFL